MSLVYANGPLTCVSRWHEWCASRQLGPDRVTLTSVAEGAQPIIEPRVMPWGGAVACVRGLEGTLIVLYTPPKDS
jgi:hypothetical protein